MLRNNRKRLGGMLCFLLMILSANAQYSVTGGSKTPLLAVNDKSKYIKVYLVYGMDNVELSYTSANSSHQWYRYKGGKALDTGVKIASELNGNTSVVRNPEEGYGYFVREGDAIPLEFIWITDYSKYAFDPQTLQAVDGDCGGFRLTGTPAIPKLLYTVPTTGYEEELQRQFEVSYQTLVWNEASKMFSRTDSVMQVDGNPFHVTKRIPAPLCDTEVRLSGDSFARYFDVEKSVSTPLYEAVKIELYSDTTMYMEEADNQIPAEGEAVSAPVEVHFSAYANSPVASLFVWKIYKGEDTGGSDEEKPREVLLHFPGEEFDYTFREEGTYTAEIEVSGRDNACAVSNSYVIKIGSSSLDIPNAFSPGTSPGINDEFRVAYKSLIEFKCWIFNRWGNQIYYWTDPTKGWDGKKGGKYVAPGVYFYVIEAKGSDGQKYNKKGSVNILRPKQIDDEVPQE